MSGEPNGARADPNISDQSGVTALMLANAYKRPSIAGILRRAGVIDSHRKLKGIPEHYCVLRRYRSAPFKTP